MLITTQESIAGHTIVETLGIVRGSTIRARHIGRDFMAGLRSIVGGEIVEYTKMMAESREQALDRMTAEAKALGADAICCVRFSTASVMENSAELLAYGTAVRLKRNDAV